MLHSGESTTTYLAEQDGLDRTVALVVSAAASDSEPGARFVATARRLATFEHPDLLPLYEVGRADGLAFAAMGAPPGKTLGALIRDGPLSPARSVEIADGVGRALEGLGAAGIGPVDLSPDDVFITDADDVQVAALAAALNPARAEAPGTTVARLLSTMVGDQPGALAPILDRAAGPDGPPEPRELVTDARAALRAPQRSRRAPIAVAAAILAIAAAAIAVLASRGGDEQRSVAAPARADAPAARLVATIPLDGTPGSTAIGSGAVWVATLEGDVLRIDPRTNRVAGAPIRFAPKDEHNNVTVRAGNGAVFALDGNRGRIARIDAGLGRVTVRRTLGGIVSGATVADGVVWVLHWDMRAGRPIDELVRLDAATLRPVGRAVPIGRPARIGPQAADVEAAGGVAWVTNGVQGTVMRFDSAAGTSTTIRVGIGVADSALVGDTLWVPDAWGGALTPVDARSLRLPDAALHTDYPFSAAGADGALWVVAQTGYAGPGGPSRLYRVDPKTRTIIGRPVDVGSDVGWVVAGDGAIWVRSSPKRALLHFAATAPAPAPARAARPRTTPPPATAGPLRPGTWATHDFAVPFTFSVPVRGWLDLGDHPEGMVIGAADDPLTTVSAYAPAQAFTPRGRVQRLRSARQAIELVARNPHLRISGRRQTSFGGIPATVLDVTVRPYRPYPRFCQSACVLLYAFPASTSGVEGARASRLWFLSHRGRTVVVIADAHPRGADFTRIETLVRTLRFR
jgi:outer membrane protein assembly factor BamB